MTFLSRKPQAVHEEVEDRLRPMHFLLLAGLLVFHSFFLLWWLQSDYRPPAWDESHHLLSALDYRQSMAAGDWKRLLRPSFFNYTPLYHISLAPLLGPSVSTDLVVDRAVLANLGYLAILVFSLFLLGHRLYSSETGLAAAVLGSFYPSVLWLLHRPLLDLPLAAWVALAYLCLIGSDQFRHLGWTALLGVVCGLGMLTKWSFAAYIGGPLVWQFFVALHGRRWGILILFLVMFGLVAGPWYLFNGLPSFLRVQKLASLSEARDPAASSLAGWTWYIRNVFNHQVLWPLSLAFFVGLGVALFHRRWEILAWLVLPLIFFSAIQNKDMRYYVPCLPAVALLTAGVPAFWRSRQKQMAWWLPLSALSVFLGVAYVSADRWPGYLPSVAAFAGLEPLPDLVASPGARDKMNNDFPQEGNWRIEEILKAIDDSRAKDQKLTRVSLISNHPHFQTWIFRLTGELFRWNHLHIASPKRRLGEFSDFILLKRGDMGPEFTLGYLTEARALLEAPPLWLEKTFTKVAEWPLPDGSSAVLYKRDVKDVAWPSQLGEVSMSLEQFPLPRFEASGLKVRLVPASPAAVKKGLFSQIVIECSRLDYRGLILRDVRLDCRNVQVNLPRLLEQKEIYFLQVGEVSPSVQIDTETLMFYLRQKASWLKNPQVTLQDGVLIQGQVGMLPLKVHARVEFSPETNSVTLRVDSAKAAGVPLPLFMARGLVRKTFSLGPSAELPFRVKVKEFSIKDGQLAVKGI